MTQKQLTLFFNIGNHISLVRQKTRRDGKDIEQVLLLIKEQVALLNKSVVDDPLIPILNSNVDFLNSLCIELNLTEFKKFGLLIYKKKSTKGRYIITLYNTATGGKYVEQRKAQKRITGLKIKSRTNLKRSVLKKDKFSKKAKQVKAKKSEDDDTSWTGPKRKKGK